MKRQEVDVMKMKREIIYFLIFMATLFWQPRVIGAEQRETYVRESFQSDQYGGWKGTRGNATGFFHVQQIDGNCWFVTPEGNVFLSIGVNSVTPKGDFAPKLGYSPYEKNVNKKYGATENWIKTTLIRLKEWGFNTIGGFSVPVDRRKSDQEALPYVITYNLGDLGGANWQEGIFPDVFDPKFKENIDRFVSVRCSKVNKDPFLIGYFLDNELDWTNAVNSMGRLGHNAPGKKALIEFAKKRYGNDFSKFMEVWESTATGFDELSRTKEIKPKKGFADKVREDRNEFLRVIARRYFEITTNAVRSYDKNHLILGVRFWFLRTPRIVVEEIGPYVDVVSVNFYTNKDEEKTPEYMRWVEGQSAKGLITERDWLKEYANLSKKPILITEFSYRAKDSGLPNTKADIPITVPTQKDRADSFEWYAQKSAGRAYIIGYHWFQYMDQPKEGRFDAENSNLGLVDIQDNPYNLLTERIKRVNREVYLIHKGVTD